MKKKVLLFSALALAFSSMAQSETPESIDLVRTLSERAKEF